MYIAFSSSSFCLFAFFPSSFFKTMTLDWLAALKISVKIGSVKDKLRHIKNFKRPTIQRQTHKHKIKLAVPGGRGRGHGWGGWAEQIQTYIGWINIKVLLDSTGNCTQYPVITHNGKEGERICRCTAKSLLHSENKCIVNQLSVQFSRSVRSDSWRPHGQSLHAKQILWVKF